MKVASWNTEARLTRFAAEGRRGSPEQIVEGIRRLDSDIVVLPEGSDGRNIEPEAMQQLEAMGYELFSVAYNDGGDREYRAAADPTMLLLSRAKVVNFQELRPGDIRTMLMADIEDPHTGQLLRVFGVHLDDRSEANRLKQVDGLLPHVNHSPLPIVAMGDFNAMHASSLPARFLSNRLVQGAIDCLPHVRTKDTLQRLSEMAIGDTLHMVEAESNLQRTNSTMRPTTTPKMRGQEWMPSIRMVQIDHIYTSPGVEVRDFQIARDGGSDHRAISATIALSGQS